MQAKAITPILNVSDIQASFDWFEKIGWKKGFEWGEPVGFGSVCSGECEIFLCENAQGGRGKGNLPRTFGSLGEEQQDKGVWMSIWVTDIHAVEQLCKSASVEITFPLTAMEWNVTEMHIRHPDGHVFRISQGASE